MHIAFNAWFWNQPHVGSGQYLQRLVFALSKLAPELKMSLILPPNTAITNPLPPNVTAISTTGRGGAIGKVLFEQRTFPRMVKACGADLAHVPYWGAPLSSPVPLITSVLDVASLILPEYYAAGFKGRAYNALISASAGGSAHIITISDSAKADIIEYLNIPAEKITTTYLGVDEVFHPKLGAENDHLVRKKYNLPMSFVLYLGGFDYRKQVNELLYAYSYVAQAEGDNYPLVMAGKEPDWGKPVFPDMRKYADQLEISDYIEWIGYVDEADKPALYRLADVFVYPSMYEGFGLPPLEAMASGVPVVANALDIFKETLGDGAYLVENARSMGGAMIALLIQKPLRDTMINQGLAQATRYTWRKTAQATLKVYESLLL
ncbi:MAG: glycosyltransferase family 1 protein [bacterium]|nr:glycosyltransferase family 1 protein [bacterium]